jgi:hypothetical protein
LRIKCTALALFREAEHTQIKLTLGKGRVNVVALVFEDDVS